jgi:hypothetical protein
MSPVITWAGLTAHIIGRSVYDIENTRDFDVVYTGPYQLPKLERLLIDSMDVGFKCDLLVDVKWIANINTIVQARPADVDFISLNYFEQDDGHGRRMIIDYTKNPKYKVVSAELVLGNFALINAPLKPHQLAYIQQHQQLPTQFTTSMKLSYVLLVLEQSTKQLKQ